MKIAACGVKPLYGDLLKSSTLESSENVYKEKFCPFISVHKDNLKPCSLGNIRPKTLVCINRKWARVVSHGLYWVWVVYLTSGKEESVDPDYIVKTVGVSRS